MSSRHDRGYPFILSQVGQLASTCHIAFLSAAVSGLASSTGRRRRAASGVHTKLKSLVMVGALLALSGPVSVGGTAVAGTTTVPRPDHIVVLVDENHSATNILGNPNAPYINGLANQNANFTQSFALTHPSQPNYIALFSGSTQGVTDNSCPHSFVAPSLGDQLISSGKTFVGYSESLPSQGFTGCSSGKYAAKHNPWVNFPSLPSSTNEPLTAFPTDFNNLPDVSYVIPNLDNDMHDGTVAQGDAWVQTHLGDYVTWAKTHNSLFVLTFDEDDNNDGNRIPTIMAGQRVTPGTYTETINHYNVLRTMQDAFGLAPLGNSATAQPILDVWNAGGANQSPTARFTPTCTDLGCSFDGSGSSDPEGPVASYAWTFGDNGTATGASPNHTYTTANTYDVKLTVTDGAGATDSVTKQVTVTAPANQPFAVDKFARTVSNGWGSADVGGAWSLTGAASAFSVLGGSGAIRHAAAGSQVTAALGAVSSSDTDLTFGFNVDKLTAGYYLTVSGRRVSASNDYRARILITSANKVNVLLAKFVGGVQTTLVADRVVPGLTYTAGMPLRVRMQVSGASPTTVRMKVWAASDPEPGAWLTSTTDSTAGLQNPGGIALTSYLSSAATNTPAVARVNDLSARRAP
jgi:PKD repeat protein